MQIEKLKITVHALKHSSVLETGKSYTSWVSLSSRSARPNFWSSTLKFWLQYWLHVEQCKGNTACQIQCSLFEDTENIHHSYLNDLVRVLLFHSKMLIHSIGWKPVSLFLKVGALTIFNKDLRQEHYPKHLTIL